MKIESLHKPLRKLRKSLKAFPKDVSAEDVHKLRTRSRRLEALAIALAPGDVSWVDGLLEEIEPLRRAAGATRDMDVLTANALKLSPSEEEDCLVRLIEHLGSMRTRSAGDLSKLVVKTRKAVRDKLKTLDRRLEKKADRPKSGKRKSSNKAANGRSSSSSAAAPALDLLADLREWPRLTADNVHAFRIKVKLLRYVLEFGEEPEAEFTAALAQVKDDVGDWHDWQQLKGLAAEILDHAGECALKTRIAQIEAEKLKQALATANALREHYLRIAGKPAKGTTSELNEAVMQSVAKLAG